MSVRGLESLRIGRSKEQGFKRSCELWERTEVLDATVFYLCSCISLSLGGYSVCLYAPLCLPASLPDGMLISKNCLPVSVSVLCLCLRIDNIYAYHMSMYRQTVIYLMSVCPSKCACIHTHTHTPHHTHYAVCIHTHTHAHIYWSACWTVEWLVHVFIVLVHQILGDQQAALVGQTCFKLGQAKNTSVSLLPSHAVLSPSTLLFGFYIQCFNWSSSVLYCVLCSYGRQKD